MSDRPTFIGASEATARDERDRHCITCGDVAETMIVLQVDTARELALCEDCSGEHHTIEVALIEEVVDGEALLVHAGTAIARAEKSSS